MNPTQIDEMAMQVITIGSMRHIIRKPANSEDMDLFVKQLNALIKEKMPGSTSEDKAKVYAAVSKKLCLPETW